MSVYKQKYSSQEEVRLEKVAYYEAEALKRDCLGLNPCEMWAIHLITLRSSPLEAELKKGFLDK